MILQEGKENLIWGKAVSGCNVAVTLLNKKITGKADKKGLFKIKLPVLASGGPYNITVKAAGQKLVIKNVLTGDVWVCSGQSNMAFTVKESKNIVQEIYQANHPKMRIFMVPKILSLSPFSDAGGRWEEVNPSSIGKFSAVGYFFGRELHKNLKKPVGLIDTSYGGTKIEWWMSGEALCPWKGFAELKKNTAAMMKKVKTPFKKSDEPVGLHKDTENEGLNQGYEKAEYPSKDWKTIKAPGYWNEQGLNFVGAVWLKKEVTIPASWKKYDLALELGPIVDYDISFFNGERVGSIGIDVPSFWSYPRRYLVPSAVLKSGKNTITVRVFAANKVGGFGAAKGKMKLSVLNNPKLGSISLEGSWRYKIERKLPSLGTVSGKKIEEGTFGTLYNSMLTPLVGFGIKGFIWYQGESNADKPGEYFELQKLFIEDLRRKWNDSGLPFYFVQLANYGTAANDWPLLRQAQQDTLSLPNTGMAVAIDVGEASDIHPKNKQDVGKRLALNALAKTYGKKIEYSGPVYKSMELKDNKAVIKFEHAESGLKIGNGKILTGFEISGKNGVFLKAKAKLGKNSVLVWNGGIKKPSAVRYAWANNPECSLYNKAGLPAVPFKTN